LIPDFYFIFEKQIDIPKDHFIFQSIVTRQDDNDDPIAIFKDILLFEIYGSNQYFFLDELIEAPEGIHYTKPGYYTFTNADNFYLDEFYFTFKLPNCTMLLIPLFFVESKPSNQK